jgi:hypothetical protein
MVRHGYAETDPRTREQGTHRSRRSRPVNCGWICELAFMADGGE